MWIFNAGSIQINRCNWGMDRNVIHLSRMAPTEGGITISSRAAHEEGIWRGEFHWQQRSEQRDWVMRSERSRKPGPELQTRPAACRLWSRDARLTREMQIPSVSGSYWIRSCRSVPLKAAALCASVTCSHRRSCCQPMWQTMRIPWKKTRELMRQTA